MALSTSSKSEIMNLIGYGLAKFDTELTSYLGFKSKTDFARFVISKGLASTLRAVFNRQDSFDPYFSNGRKGWHQRNQREHIKLLIDSLFGTLNSQQFANLVYGLVSSNEDSGVIMPSTYITPIDVSRFQKMQETGIQAEYFFMNNYQKLPMFSDSKLEDARLWGNGFDFQITDTMNIINLVEVKGVRTQNGAIRMTDKEYSIARAYKDTFHLVIVANLNHAPYMNCITNPLESLQLTKYYIELKQISYHTLPLEWKQTI